MYFSHYNDKLFAISIFLAISSNDPANLARMTNGFKKLFSLSVIYKKLTDGHIVSNFLMSKLTGDVGFKMIQLIHKMP